MVLFLRSKTMSLASSRFGAGYSAKSSGGRLKLKLESFIHIERGLVLKGANIRPPKGRCQVKRQLITRNHRDSDLDHVIPKIWIGLGHDLWVNNTDRRLNS